MYWKVHDNSPECPCRIGITGGIGSGKSYVCEKIKALGYPVFYCDDEAKHIIRTSDKVKEALKNLVGPTVYDDEGKLDKRVLSSYICKGNSYASRVNAIVHPCVAEAFRQWCSRQTAPLVFMECAILFESGFDSLVDITATVVVSEKLRLSRVMARDKVTEAKAKEWMSLQLPEKEKAIRSDFLLHNEGDIRLDADIRKLISASSANKA